MIPIKSWFFKNNFYKKYFARLLYKISRLVNNFWLCFLNQKCILSKKFENFLSNFVLKNKTTNLTRQETLNKTLAQDFSPF